SVAPGALAPGGRGGGADVFPPYPRAADFRRGQKRGVVGQCRDFGLVGPTCRPPGRARRDRFEHRDVRLASQHVEARVEFVDPVMDRLELGRLVDDVYRRLDLPSVVQYAGKLRFLTSASRYVARDQGAADWCFPRTDGGT